MSKLPRGLMVGGALAILIGAILELVERSAGGRATAPTKASFGDVVVQQTIGTAEKVRDLVGDALAESAARVRETDIAGPATSGADVVAEKVGQLRETARRQMESASSDAKERLSEAAGDMKKEAAHEKATAKRRAQATSNAAKGAAAATKKKAASASTKATRKAAGTTAPVRGAAARTTTKSTGKPKES